MDNKLFSSRSLTDSGLFSAVTLILMLISLYVPIIGIVAIMVLSVPLMIIVVKHNIQNGVLAAFVIFALAGLLFGPLAGTVSSVTVIVLGLAYGYCFKRQISPGKTLFVGTLACGIAGFLIVLISAFAGNMGLATIISQMETVIDSALVLYQEKGLITNGMINGMTIAQFKAAYIEMLKLLLPGAVVGSLMIWATANYLVAQKILKRMNFNIRSLPVFRLWHLPFNLVWGVIAALALFVIGTYFNVDICSMIAKNILYVYYPLFAVSGISMLIYLLHMWHFTPLMQFAVFLMLMAFPGISITAILLIGLFDTMFDFRKLIQKTFKK